MLSSGSIAISNSLKVASCNVDLEANLDIHLVFCTRNFLRPLVAELACTESQIKANHIKTSVEKMTTMLKTHFKVEDECRMPL